MGNFSDPGLVGRDYELKLVRSFLEQSAVRGGSLILSGEPGIGKTAVLDTAAGAAFDRARVLRANGVPSESDVEYSGLHQLLVPLFAEFSRLPPPLRSALDVALGLVDGPSPETLRVSTAMLALLRSVAAKPLVVIIDDLQWLDRTSCAVLVFVGRRLAESRIGLLAARRPETDSFFDRAGLPEHELRPLDDGAASDLLRAQFPALPGHARRRIVGTSRGNPLALIALAATAGGHNGGEVLGSLEHLVDRRRVQALFESQLSELSSTLLSNTRDRHSETDTALRSATATATATATAAQASNADDHTATAHRMLQPRTRRVSAELRATGEARDWIYGGGPSSLTPQEREVAELAASGQTNKQIGAQLYLSHRTVAAHLYRIFPKLSITSRAALRDALTA